MTWNAFLELFLSGSLVAAIASVFTLRHTVKEARAKATQAEVDVEALHITNTENATRILVQNIVEPLKNELHVTRQELEQYKKDMQRLLNAQKREMARLRKAIDSANACNYRDGCPVIERMRDEKPDNAVGVGGDGGVGSEGTDADADVVLRP